jgi:hypothetical protein
VFHLGRMARRVLDPERRLLARHVQRRTATCGNSGNHHAPAGGHNARPFPRRQRSGAPARRGRTAARARRRAAGELAGLVCSKRTPSRRASRCRHKA